MIYFGILTAKNACSGSFLIKHVSFRLLQLNLCTDMLNALNLKYMHWWWDISFKTFISVAPLLMLLQCYIILKWPFVRLTIFVGRKSYILCAKNWLLLLCLDYVLIKHNCLLLFNRIWQTGSENLNYYSHFYTLNQQSLDILIHGSSPRTWGSEYSC